MSHLVISQQIEDLLTARNPRDMQTLQAALTPGYYYRAAQMLQNISGHVLIGTGFPVNNTYETDGPVGAIALYQAIESLGATPILVCGAPLADAISDGYHVHKITVGEPETSAREAQLVLDKYQPTLVISIERPGMAADGHYYNMRGENISARCASFDYFLTLANCPTIAIGDGGN